MSDKVTKVLRLEVVKPLDGDWKAVAMRLRAIQNATARALNEVMRKHYLRAAPVAEEILQAGNWPTSKDVAANKSYTKELGKKYSGVMNSGVYGQADRDAQQRWINDWRRVLVRGDMSLPSYRNNCPIGVRGDHTRIWEERNGEHTDRFIAVKLRPKENGRVPEEVFVLHGKSFDESRTAIWERLISGEYEKGKVQILWSERKRKWFVNICYRFTPAEVAGLDPKVIVGVDLGIAVPVVLALSNRHERAYLREEGQTITSFRNQLERRRRALRRNEQGILERRSGHGRKHKIEPIEKLRELEKNFRRTANHRLSKAVVNFAMRHGAGRIVMEKLEGFREQKIQERIEQEEEGKKGGRVYFLEQWSTFELQTMIKQKGEEAGIAVSFVSPRYTSQRCSACGHIARENRKTQSGFKCVICGYPRGKEFINADYNAARNLATPEIERLITESVGSGLDETNVRRVKKTGRKGLRK